METKTTTSSEFPNGGKATVEQMLGSKEINQLSMNVRVTFSDSSRKLNHLSEVVRDRKIIRFNQVYQFCQNMLSHLYTMLLGNAHIAG